MINNNNDSDNVPEMLNRNSNEIIYPRLSSRTNINQYFTLRLDSEFLLHE